MRSEELPLRPWASGALPVPTGAEAASFDRAAIERGVPQAALMEAAGRAAADLIAQLSPRGAIAVLVGTGHNGGDGVIAARTLVARGRDVRLVVVGERPEPDPLLHGWTLPIVRVTTTEWPEDALPADLSLVVDAVLGTGLTGPPRPLQAAAIRALARWRGPVVSLDVPSGVDADSGACPGPAVHAAATLAFGWPKLGVLLEPGRSRAGRVVAAEIGFPPPADGDFGARLLTPAWARQALPRRATVTHKNRVGSVAVVGGSSGMAGSVILAARAALRSGAGYVRIVSAAGNRSPIQAALPDATFAAYDDPDACGEALASARALVVGPGMGTGAGREAVLERVLAAEQPTVIDADALNLLALGRPFGPGGLGGAGARVLTPHPGEMARLLAIEVAEVESDRPAAARRLALQSGATVVLKGAPTLIAEPDGALAISGLTSSDLAVAGMGDVLGGSLAAFLAQGAAPDAAAGLALLYGARAALMTRRGRGLTASDVVEALPSAIAEQGSAATDLPFHWLTLDLDPPS